MVHYRRGCALGDPRGCELGGLSLLAGSLGAATPPGRAAAPPNLRFADPDGAAALLGRACPRRRSACAPLALAGHLSAAARAVHDGAGVRRDRAIAARLRERGCTLRDADSCRQLALQYRWGNGVTIDWIRSAELLVRACELGSTRACLWH
jgi:hypothetical protein